MAGGSPLCLAGRWSVDWFWQRDWQNVGWLLIGGWLGVFYCKMETKYWRFFQQLTECMAGGSPLCLAGWWWVDWFWQRDWQNVGLLLVGGWLGVFYCKIQTKKLTGFFLAVDWLHGWRLPSLLSWSVVGWLVLAKRLTECWLAVGWGMAQCFFTAKLRLKNWRIFLEHLTDCMAGSSPLFLAGRWSIDWFWQRDRQNVGGWLGVFYYKIETKKLTGFSWAVDWLHG